MRLWSVHPKYLDAKGLTALWREGLLAKRVLEGRTQSYKNHPQLARFKMARDPVLYVIYYLSHIHKEAAKRGYNFDIGRLGRVYGANPMQITKGQLDHEFGHLKNKLRTRDPAKYKELLKVKRIESHPSFSVRKGPVEVWEKV